jgi:hypothetical protein
VAVGLAVVLGLAFAWQLWLVVALYGQARDLRAQVTRLTGAVCYYQVLTTEINKRLVKKGFPKVHVPPAVPCTPQPPQK